MGALRHLSCGLLVAGVLCAATGSVSAAPARTKARTKKKAAPAARPRAPYLPPARPGRQGLVILRRDDPASAEQREKVATLEQELAEAQAREKQTQAKLEELRTLIGQTTAAPDDPNARAARMVELYRRLDQIDRERKQLNLSPNPDKNGLKQLEEERQAIVAWMRAALNDPAVPIVAAKFVPSPEMLTAVEVAKAEVAAAQRYTERTQRMVDQGLVAPAEALRARSDLAHARAAQARAEARVRNDREGELIAARAQLDAALADFNAAEAEVASLYNLQRAGAVARMDVVAAEARLRKARTALDSARAEVKRLEAEAPPKKNAAAP